MSYADFLKGWIPDVIERPRTSKKGIHIIRAMFPEVDVKTPRHLSFPIDIVPPDPRAIEFEYRFGPLERYGNFGTTMGPIYVGKVYW